MAVGQDKQRRQNKAAGYKWFGASGAEVQMLNISFSIVICTKFNRREILILMPAQSPIRKQIDFYRISFSTSFKNQSI